MATRIHPWRTTAIVTDFDETFPRILNTDANTDRAGIKRVFNQFFDH
jgi:hypothetical protein